MIPAQRKRKYLSFHVLCLNLLDDSIRDSWRIGAWRPLIENLSEECSHKMLKHNSCSKAVIRCLFLRFPLRLKVLCFRYQFFELVIFVDDYITQFCWFFFELQNLLLQRSFSPLVAFWSFNTISLCRGIFQPPKYPRWPCMCVYSVLLFMPFWRHFHGTSKPFQAYFADGVIVAA